MNEIKAKFYDFLNNLLIENGCESKSHFLEILADNSHEIADKFDEITEQLR